MYTIFTPELYICTPVSVHHMNKINNQPALYMAIISCAERTIINSVAREGGGRQFHCKLYNFMQGNLLVLLPHYEVTCCTFLMKPCWVSEARLLSDSSE